MKWYILDMAGAPPRSSLLGCPTHPSAAVRVGGKPLTAAPFPRELF